jgi:dihydroorotate dehydrogenase subfamily 2
METPLLKHCSLSASRALYRALLRPIIFRFDSESVHNFFVALGEKIGKSRTARNVARSLWSVASPLLGQHIHGIHFKNPVGLAAGFDYDAKLMRVLPSVGFGFETVGTVTNHPYAGNDFPRLGRLVRSRSLMVNKGLKNDGVSAVLDRTEEEKFEIPVGLSIGPTNSPNTSSTDKAIADVIAAFHRAEHDTSPFAYYELNISCPNLAKGADFYAPKHLDDLLAAVTSLKLKKPLFVKMPIEKSEKETMAMIEVIATHSVEGIVIGNLQKNRLDSSLDPGEVARYPRGYFSGKPTEQKSNELIRLAFKQYGKRLTIIGCGGIFSAEDAYHKIRLGASLVQLITGLIFEGPQLAGSINAQLVKFLERDGYKNIAEAVGVDT